MKIFVALYRGLVLVERVAGVVVVRAEELALLFEQSEPEFFEIPVEGVYLIGHGEAAPRRDIVGVCARKHAEDS